MGRPTSKRCDWCGGANTALTTYQVSGPENGKPKKARIRICECCSAWGVLSENWYGFDERIRDLTGIDFDKNAEGDMLVTLS